MKDQRKILVGVIMGAHGVQGAMRLRSLTAEPESIFAYKSLTDESGSRKFALKLKGVMKDYFVVSLQGVSGRDEAEALRGIKLFVARSALPPAGEHEYYEADLIGLKAEGKDGKSYGTVKALHDYGAGAFLEIQPAQGGSFMLPFTDACVPEVDVTAGHVTVVMPDGWLEKEKPAI